MDASVDLAKLAARLEAQLSADGPLAIEAASDTDRAATQSDGLAKLLAGSRIDARIQARLMKNPPWRDRSQALSRALLQKALERSLGWPEGAAGASIAHSGAAAAAAVHSRASIGIDLERSGREPSIRVVQRMLHAGDQPGGLAPIGVWAVKEAIYKSGPGGSFREIQIGLASMGEARWMGHASFKGEAYRLAVVQDANWLLAVAVRVLFSAGE